MIVYDYYTKIRLQAAYRRLRLQVNTQLRVAPASVKYPNSGWLRLQLNTPIPSGSGSISETLEEGLEL